MGFMKVIYTWSIFIMVPLPCPQCNEVTVEERIGSSSNDVTAGERREALKTLLEPDHVYIIFYQNNSSNPVSAPAILNAKFP